MAYQPYLGGELPNIVNVTKAMNPDGTIAKIAELLVQSNPMLLDIPMIEGNLPTGHRTTMRADTPTPTWRKLNYGVRPTKSTTVQVDDTIGMCEDFGEVDAELANLNGNTAEFRMSQDKPHIDGMSNEMASSLIYADTSVNPEEFLGIAPRFDQLTLTGKPAVQQQSAHLPNVIDLGGSGGNLTSIYGIAWGEDTVHGVYPKGSSAGLLAEDLGKTVLTDNDGGRFMGYRSHYQWKMGLSVADWRAITRIVNIDLSNLEDGATQILLYKAIIKSMHAVPPQYRNRLKFYCSPAISAMLDFAAVEKGNVHLGRTEVFGEEIMSFRGRPLRESHAILETETAVT